MQRADLKDFSLTNRNFKYPVTDITSSLRGRKVHYELFIEFIPTFGWIHRVN